MKLSEKKRPSDFSPDETISEKVNQESRNGALSCAAAFRLSDLFDISKQEVGFYADSLNLKLSKCRIGLFGYGKGVKLVKELDSIDETLEKRVGALLADGILTCENVFRIADEFKVSLVDVGSVCQTKGIKIKHCQLGAF